MNIRTFARGAAVAALIAAPAGAVEIQQLTSPGGQVFWLVEEPSIPIVSLEIAFRGGNRLDPDGKEGVGNFMTGLLEEGAGDLDAVAFSNRADELSARFGFSMSRDQSSVSASFLVETLDEATDLLATAMTAPRFDPEPVDRVRKQILSSIAQSETDPDSIASRTWFARAFPGHPYGRPADGTAESVAALTVEDLRAAHARALTRANAYIGIVGAIGADRAGAMVDRLVAGLPEGEPVEDAPVSAPPPPGLEVVDLDVPQSVAVIGQPGIPRDDPDFFAAYVMNYVLGGGGFTSRLTEEVREKRGLAYSVYSYLMPMDEAKLYMAGVQTANERIADSLDVIRAEWAKMAAEGLSQEDLEKAKTYLTGSFPLQFDSNAKIANYLVFMQIDDLGADYLETRNAKMEAVTLEDANRVAKRLLDPDALSIVVVGKPVGLTSN